MIGISAVIATINRKAELKRLFNSFIANSLDCVELIVVDQNTNGLIDDLINEYSSILTIKHFKLTEANQSKARNYGAAYARYSIICFPDDDCWFEDNTLTRVIEHFHESSQTGLLIINWKQNQKKCINSLTLTRELIYSFKAPISYGTIVLFFNKDAFFEIGGFLENIGLGLYISGGEDSEIIFKAAKNNLKIYYDKDVFVNHNFNPTNNRTLLSIRSRERASGFLYSKYSIPLFVIIRGLFSPLIKMVFCLNRKEMKTHYSTFIARIEGTLYGIRN